MQQNYFQALSEEGFHRIAYLEWGKANNHQAIICVHGLSRNSHDFDPLAQHLSTDHYHVFCPDIVGRGDSDWLKNAVHYTYEQYISDMTLLIARTQAKEIAWIGTSMGGIIGMFLASMPNSPIKCLILNDVGAQVPAKAIARLAAYAGKDPEFKSLDDAIKHFKNIYAPFGRLSEEEWHLLTKHSLKEVSPNRYVTKLDHRVKIASAKSKLAWKSLLHPYKALEGVLFDVDLWPIWRKVNCPVLIIHGKESDLLLPNIIEKMQKCHSDTEVLGIEKAGHAPALFDSAIHQKIKDWLRKKF